MKVTFQHATMDAEYQIAYIARGSNPPNQDNPEFKKLFSYCLKSNHWSPFQMADMCLQFETSLAVAAQVKRHWSMAICEPADVQETSMRYMDPLEHEWGFQEIEFRKAGKTNRQSSEEPLSELQQKMVSQDIEHYFTTLRQLRERLKEYKVANETIRMLYPAATTTRFFIKGSCRSWIHYFQQRLDIHAQLEHRQVAREAYDHFRSVFPAVAEICEQLNWFYLSEFEGK